MIFNSLKEHKVILRDINLFDNELDDDCMKPLGEFIQSNQATGYINVGKNNVTDKGIEAILPYLISNITLKKFDVSYNLGITNKSVPLLTEIIKKSNVEDINIFGTSIADNGNNKVQSALSIPIDQREVPLITIENVKSASKLS